MHFEHQSALNGWTAMDLGVDIETLHSFHVLRLRLVQMRECPTQPADRLLFVDCLHSCQKPFNAAAQLRVHIEVNAVLGQTEA